MEREAGLKPAHLTWKIIALPTELPPLVIQKSPVSHKAGRGLGPV